jgi:hypothetical protein
MKKTKSVRFSGSVHMFFALKLEGLLTLVFELLKKAESIVDGFSDPPKGKIKYTISPFSTVKLTRRGCRGARCEGFCLCYNGYAVGLNCERIIDLVKKQG